MSSSYHHKHTLLPLESKDTNEEPSTQKNIQVVKNINNTVELRNKDNIIS